MRPPEKLRRAPVWPGTPPSGRLPYEIAKRALRLFLICVFMRWLSGGCRRIEWGSGSIEVVDVFRKFFAVIKMLQPRNCKIRLCAIVYMAKNAVG